MSASTPTYQYSFGTDADRAAVTLTIDTEAIDLERFRADLPHIIAMLECFISGARGQLG